MDPPSVKLLLLIFMDEEEGICAVHPAAMIQDRMTAAVETDVVRMGEGEEDR